MKKIIRSIMALLISPSLLVILPFFVFLDWLMDDAPVYYMAIDTIKGWYKWLTLRG